MELTSPIFFYALGLLFALHWASPKSLRSLVLLAGSYLLYSLWDFRYLFILVGSTLLDFTLGILIDRAAAPTRRRSLLVLSLISNLGILFYFKYTGFFLDFSHQVQSYFGSSSQPPVFSVFIPLGVSFYTFHSISYVVDIYRRKIPACRSLVEYALYVSFFPKLISGPIERTENFLGQLRDDRHLKWENQFQAVKLLLYGLFLKLCVGDRLNYVTDHVFNSYQTASRPELWLGCYAYSLQIYADFFGYTLIARGSALLFDLKLSPNFLNPYLSASPQEFWRRWHVSLSSWFRDYVYIPLGGGRRRVYLNILITMALAGLWHGANLKFVFWGVFHGFLVVLQRLIFGDQREVHGWKRWVGIPLTFQFVSFGWILFKAKDFSTAVGYFGRMFTAPWDSSIWQTPALLWVLILLSVWGVSRALLRLYDAAPVTRFDHKVHYFLPVRGAILGCLLFLVVLLGVSNAEPFVYFYF